MVKLRYLELWEVKEARVQELSTCSVCLFLCLFCVFCFVVWFLFCFSRFWLVPLFLWVIVCFRSFLLHKVTLCSPNIGIVGIIKEVDYGTVPPFRQSVHFCARVGKKNEKKKKRDWCSRAQQNSGNEAPSSQSCKRRADNVVVFFRWSFFDSRDRLLWIGGTAGCLF